MSIRTALMVFALFLSVAYVPPMPEHGYAHDRESALPPSAQETLARYEPLLARIHGVVGLRAERCRLEAATPLLPCIVIRLESATDLAVLRAVFANPLDLDGVIVFFTDREPIPSRGGITINN